MPRQQKKRPASTSRFSILWWVVRGSACSAGVRCGASRLARCAGKRSRVYSAPRPDGFEPVHRQQKSDQPESIAFFSMVGRQGFGPAARAAAAALSRLARRAGKRSRVSSAPRPFGLEPMKGRQKRRPTEVDRLNNLWVGRQGFEPWTLGLKGAPCLISQLDSATLHPL